MLLTLYCTNDNCNVVVCLLFYCLVLQKLEAARRPPVQEGFNISAPVQEQVNKVEPVQEHRNGAHKQIDGRQEKENGTHVRMYAFICAYVCA